jgi:hypothetical protein
MNALHYIGFDVHKKTISFWRVADVCDDMTRFIIQCELENNWGVPTPCDLRRR